MAYVNKMDITGADFYNVIKMMKERLQANAVAIQLPIGAEDDFKGIVDLIKMEAIVYEDDLGKVADEVAIPEDMQELAEEYREKLLEAVAEIDEPQPEIDCRNCYRDLRLPETSVCQVRNPALPEVWQAYFQAV